MAVGGLGAVPPAADNTLIFDFSSPNCPSMHLICDQILQNQPYGRKRQK